MRNLDEIVKDIKTVLEEKVAPSVAAHNGSIGFISFAPDTGVATLKHYVPEVQSIVGKDDEEAEGQGYDPYFPKDKEPDWEKLVRHKYE